MLTTAICCLAILRQDRIVFARKYEAGKSVDYAMDIDVSMGLKANIHAVIHVTVDKIMDNGKPQVSFKTSSFAASPPDFKVDHPADVTSKVMFRNIRQDLVIKDTDFVYMFLAAAGLTADKALSVGDTFNLNWSVPAVDMKGESGDVTLSGTGKITGAPESKPIAVEYTYATSTKGKAMGDLIFKSTFDPSDRSLIDSDGSFLQGVYHIKIHRQ